MRGPLNVRPPQGYPVVVQAGSSGDGKHLAAKHADLVFCWYARSGKASIPEGFRRAPPPHQACAQRSHGSTGILPIVAVRAEAQGSVISWKRWCPRVGIDLVSELVRQGSTSAYPVDGPLPPLPDLSTYDGQRTKSRKAEGLRQKNLTIARLPGTYLECGRAL